MQLSIAANKFKVTYCIVCESIITAPKTAVINNDNVLAVGERIVGAGNTCEMVDAWLAQSFCKDFTPKRAEFMGGLLKKLK